jgi:hypothetical protein
MNIRFSPPFVLLAFLTSCIPQSSITLTSKNATYPAEWNTVPDAKNLQQPSAADILANTAKVYASLRFYEDKGTQATIYNSHQFIYGRKLEFVTAFRNSDIFRFECWGVNALGFREAVYMNWKNKNGVKAWMEVSGVLNTPNIRIAIADAAGRCGDGGYFIPVLLLKDNMLSDFVWITNPNVYRISDITENKVAYYRVQKINTIVEPSITKVKTTKETFWIRKDTSLLMRVETDTAFDWSSHTVIQYHPVINKKIADSAFEFGH